MNFEELVKQALEKARQLHKPIQTRHEAYAVLLEELDEYWEEVKKKAPIKADMLKELVQVAAMCQRAAEDLDLTKEQLLSVSP